MTKLASKTFILLFFFILFLKNGKSLFGAEEVNPLNIICSHDDDSFLSQILEVPEEIVCDLAKSFRFTDKCKGQIEFLLYLPSNDQPITVSPQNFSQFANLSNPTIFITHGFVSNARQPWLVKMASNFHKTRTCNVVGVDWEEAASQNYFSAAADTRIVGYTIGDFILELKEKTSFNLDITQLIGHSLGAHASGFAGKRIEERSKQKVGRVTGLDAAKPLFEIPFPRFPSSRLARSDGKFVDLIHSDPNFLGVALTYGDQDFFVNHNRAEPNCTDQILNVIEYNICRHRMSREYYSNSILSPKKYKAVDCLNFIFFSLGACSHGKRAIMGDGANEAQHGTFYINVHKNDAVGIP